MEEDEFIEVRFNLPGFDKKDFHIEIQRYSVRIKAERKQSHEIVRKDSYKSHQSSAAVYREMALPSEVVPDSAETKYEQGILAIKLRKKAARKAEKQKAK